jgi:hypothetical protein
VLIGVFVHHRPAVKFWNINESTLQIVQTGGNHGSEDDEVADLEEEAELECESDDEPDVHIAGPPPQAFAFKIDIDIDIDSKALRDMVSVILEVRGAAQPHQASSRTTAQVSEAPDWNW